jgi:hypothetical protein
MNLLAQASLHVLLYEPDVLIRRSYLCAEEIIWVSAGDVIAVWMGLCSRCADNSTLTDIVWATKYSKINSYNKTNDMH